MPLDEFVTLKVRAKRLQAANAEAQQLSTKRRALQSGAKCSRIPHQSENTAQGSSDTDRGVEAYVARGGRKWRRLELKKLAEVGTVGRVRGISLEKMEVEVGLR